MTRHLVIGGGPAAINAIEAIRDVDGGANPITLISDEPAYSRMVLPYYLAARIPETQIYTADNAFYDALKVDRRIGIRVTRIDPQAKSVSLQDGQELSFDNLLIATGSSPTMPPISGADLPGVYPLWIFAHTDAVLHATSGKPTPEVAFIGAGFIGFIVLNAMFKRGWKLHVIEIADHVLPRMLDGDSAKLVENWLERKGVARHLKTTVQSIAALNNRKRLLLANGQQLDVDLVIVATGIRPNMELAAGAGIRT